MWWWVQTWEVLCMCGIISWEHPWEVMPDLCFYRGPEEFEKEEQVAAEKAAWIWLVKVPGLKWPVIGIAPVAATNFSTAHWLVFLEDVTLTSAGFSKATMAPASSFSQVFFRFLM